MIWPTTILSCILAMSQMVVSSAAGQLENLPTDKGKRIVEIESIPIHPWFGSGERDWDLMLSRLFDTVLVENDGSFKTLPGIGVSKLFLSYLDNQIKNEDAEVPDVSPETQKAIERVEEVKKLIAELQLKIASATGAERVKLRRELEKSQDELLSLRAAIGDAGQRVTPVYNQLKEKSKDYLLDGGILRLEAQPLLGEYGVLSDWTSVDLSQKSECVRYWPVDEAGTNRMLNGLTRHAEVNRFTIHRKWASTIFGTESTFRFVGVPEELVSIKELSERRLFKVDAIYLARYVEFRGGLTLSDINLLATDRPSSDNIKAGCTSAVFTSGLGFSGAANYPLSLPSGFAVYFPQIIAVEISPLPTVEINE